MELYEQDDAARNYRDRNRENRARLASVFAKFRSTGQGTHVFPERVDFGLTFIEEPFPSYCPKIDLDDWADLLDVTADADDPPPLPAATGFVHEWDQDERGFYVGAWVAVSVWFPVIDPAATEPLVPVDSQPQVDHFFTFTAVALKDVDPGVDAE